MAKKKPKLTAMTVTEYVDKYGKPKSSGLRRRLRESKPVPGVVEYHQPNERLTILYVDENCEELSGVQNVDK